MKIFVDFETTGINPMYDEIITGYFLKEDGEFYHFKSKVRRWSDEAEAIHGISYDEMMTYPEKEFAFKSLLKWLPEKFDLVCYANPQTRLGHMYFDGAILRENLCDNLNVIRYEDLPIMFKCVSVHTMAKDLESRGYITAPRGESGRKTFRQEALYEKLFSDTYDSHKAEDDVLAMVKIYNTLREVILTGKSIADRKQLRLI